MQRNIHVAVQGVDLKLSTEQLLLFLQKEVQFWNEAQGLLQEGLVIDGRQVGSSSIFHGSMNQLNAVLEGAKKNEFDAIKKFLENARNLNILIWQSSMGEKVITLRRMAKNAEAKCMLYIFSDQSNDNHTHTFLTVARAAIAGHPALDAFADFVSAKNSVAEAVASREASDEAAKKLDAFITDKSRAIGELEHLYAEKLLIERPARFWQKLAAAKRVQWHAWLALFALLIVVPIAMIGYEWKEVAAGIKDITGVSNGGVSLAGVALVTVPTLLYAWLLKAISRIFTQTMTLADDAEHRRALSITYLGLSKNSKLAMSSEERALILNALFRPLPTHPADEGPPNGLLDLIKGKAGT